MRENYLRAMRSRDAELARRGRAGAANNTARSPRGGYSARFLVVCVQNQSRYGVATPRGWTSAIGPSRMNAAQ